MSALMDSNPALFSAVMWHGAAFLPLLRQMPYAQVQVRAWPIREIVTLNSKPNDNKGS